MKGLSVLILTVIFLHQFSFAQEPIRLFPTTQTAPNSFAPKSIYFVNNGNVPYILYTADNPTTREETLQGSVDANSKTIELKTHEGQIWHARPIDNRNALFKITVSSEPVKTYTLPTRIFPPKEELLEVLFREGAKGVGQAAENFQKDFDKKSLEIKESFEAGPCILIGEILNEREQVENDLSTMTEFVKKQEEMFLNSLGISTPIDASELVQIVQPGLNNTLNQIFPNQKVTNRLMALMTNINQEDSPEELFLDMICQTSIRKRMGQRFRNAGTKMGLKGFPNINQKSDWIGLVLGVSVGKAAGVQYNYHFLFNMNGRDQLLFSSIGAGLISGASAAANVRVEVLLGVTKDDILKSNWGFSASGGEGVKEVLQNATAFSQFFELPSENNASGEMTTGDELAFNDSGRRSTNNNSQNRPSNSSRQEPPVSQNEEPEPHNSETPRPESDEPDDISNSEDLTSNDSERSSRRLDRTENINQSNNSVISPENEQPTPSNTQRQNLNNQSKKNKLKGKLLSPQITIHTLFINDRFIGMSFGEQTDLLNSVGSLSVSYFGNILH